MLGKLSELRRNEIGNPLSSPPLTRFGGFLLFKNIVYFRDRC